MRKSALLFVFLTFSIFLAKAQLPGSTCENPLFVDPIASPLVGFAINSENYGNDYNSTMITPSSTYLNGNDIVFQFTLAAKSYIISSIQGYLYRAIFCCNLPECYNSGNKTCFCWFFNRRDYPDFCA